MKIVPVFYIYAFLLTFCCLFSISIKVKQTNMETVEFVQVVSRGCGLDVHKKTVVATIDGEGLKRETP